MPILAVSGVNTRVKVHQILLPQREAARAIGLGTTRNIQFFFSISLLGSVSHLSSLHLPFTASYTVGHSVLILVLCWTFPAAAQAHCRSRHSSVGFQYTKYGADQAGQLCWYVLSPWKSPSSVYGRLDSSLSSARTSSPLRL